VKATVDVTKCSPGPRSRASRRAGLRSPIIRNALSPGGAKQGEMHVAMVQVRVAVAVGLSAVSLASVMAVVAQPASAQEEGTYSTPPGVTSVSRPNPQLAQAVATGVRTQTLLSGRITRPEDVVVEGLEIAAYLEPARDLTARAPHGAAFELVRLASAESDAQGDFTLRVPLI
jgi:hypothetical protein